MSIPRALYRDLDGVDLDRDEFVSAAFFDELALPPVRRLRRGYRPSLSSAIGHAVHRVAADPSPHVSSSRERLGPLSSTKESRA